MPDQEYNAQHDEPTQALSQSDLLGLLSKRDEAIVEMWKLMREIREKLNSEMTDEDLDVWVAAANHSAIQNIISEGYECPCCGGESCMCDPKEVEYATSNT